MVVFFKEKRGRGTKKVENSVFERKKRKKDKEKSAKEKIRKAKRQSWFRKSEPLDKRGRKEGQNERYPSTKRRISLPTMPKQRRDNKRVLFFFTLFKSFEFKKQLIKRPTKSKRLKGSITKYEITISRNPKRKEITRAEKNPFSNNKV